jgi:hypothetical protein
MMSPKARLVIAASLFVAWIGCLVYVVVQSRNPVILSRPQFLAADVYVTARIDANDGKPAATITIEEALWTDPKKVDKAPAPGERITIHVTIQPDDSSTARETKQLHDIDPPLGWSGAGVYVLPLTKAGSDYFLTGVAPSPGYVPTERDRLRIYLATDDALRQARRLAAERP